MGAVLVLVAVNIGTLPVPDVAANPISGVGTVRDQLKVAPGTLLVNTTEGTLAPAQYVWLATALTWGLGLTVMVNWIGVPVQVTPLLVKVATTLKVDVIGALLVLVVIKVGTFPLPDVGASPISGTGTVRDQLKAAPGILLVKTIDGTVEPVQ